MHRRDFLAAAFAASVGSLGALAQERAGRSKIIDIRLLRLRMARDVGTLEPLRKQLIGRDPFDTEQHAARLRNYASAASLPRAALLRRCSTLGI